MADQSNSDFWSVQNETGALERLLSRVDYATIFADENFTQIAKPNINPLRTRLITLPKSADNFDVRPFVGDIAKRNVFLFSTTDFPAFHRVLSQEASAQSGRCVDWRYDVFPSLVGFNDSWRMTSAAEREPDRTYVIASTARSGSTFLSDLLLQNGLGNPKEHIRTPFIELIRRRHDFDLDLSRLLPMLARRCARNGYFATKVISGFYQNVVSEITKDEQQVFFDNLWSKPVVYLVRETKVEQAVSDIIARQTRTWHVRSEADLEQYRKRTEQLSFDFNEIDGRFLAYIKDELWLRAFLKDLPNITKITFKELVDDPQKAMQKVATFVSGKPFQGNIQTGSNLIRTFSDKNQEFCELYVAEVKRRGLYRDRLDDPLFAELL